MNRNTDVAAYVELAIDALECALELAPDGPGRKLLRDACEDLVHTHIGAFDPDHGWDYRTGQPESAYTLPQRRAMEIIRRTLPDLRRSEWRGEDELILRPRAISHNTQ